MTPLVSEITDGLKNTTEKLVKTKLDMYAAHKIHHLKRLRDLMDRPEAPRQVFEAGRVVITNVSGGDLTVNFPDTWARRPFNISSATIGGAANAVTVQSDGSHWVTIDDPIIDSDNPVTDIKNHAIRTMRQL